MREAGFPRPRMLRIKTTAPMGVRIIMAKTTGIKIRTVLIRDKAEPPVDFLQILPCRFTAVPEYPADAKFPGLFHIIRGIVKKDNGPVRQPGWLSHKPCGKRKFLTKSAFSAFFKRLLFKN
jgi:hypothetical protein